MIVLGAPIDDSRIGCKNYLLEMPINEYYEFAKDILKNNEYQRRRVKSSSTVYSLLKDDLRQGCIMPPIVLALTQVVGDKDDVKEVIMQNKERLIILDGLQRSYTIRDLVKEIESSQSESKALNNPIRIELYTGINKFGILYRMLTYNTGQTQMSTRHQIEIIYSDYIGREKYGIKFIREIEDSAPRKLGEYKFRDMVDGFSSYLERDYLSIERIDILNSIKSLQELTKEDPKAEIFDVFIDCYHGLVMKINEQASTWTPNKEELDLERVFSSNVVSMFNKSQPLTGFGAAIGKLIDQKTYDNIAAIQNKISSLEISDVEEGLNLLTCKMDTVRRNAKKIGNDQRLFFFQYFRGFLDYEAESFMNMKKAVEYAYRQYEREAM